jgi:hypothetical protein
MPNKSAQEIRSGSLTERELCRGAVGMPFADVFPPPRFADYFTVGCKTEDGFTVMLVERGPGVETSQIKTSYSATAGTAYITFDNVKVPVENTLGEEGGGIFVILRCVFVSAKYVDIPVFDAGS